LDGILSDEKLTELLALQTEYPEPRDYERYVGYLYEQDGCTVSYYGIEKGLETSGAT
jgi:hypothetical protein